ncbi:hypothetical protein [Nostoc sp. DedQUE03]|nr:hypothetical protein [Nostoc sp. DedQUE03]MDZ7975507.1 hypothetical protein [Nostoc sp. DedQUE03]
MVAQAQPLASKCLGIKEETLSKKTIIRKFPTFNIQLEIAENTNAIQMTEGSILIVDRGTYKYLKCLETNGRVFGRDIFGLLISKGTESYPINEQLPNRPSTYIVATKDYKSMALRFIFDNGNTDISLYGGGPLESKQEVKDELDSLLKILKAVTFLSNY